MFGRRGGRRDANHATRAGELPLAGVAWELRRHGSHDPHHRSRPRRASLAAARARSWGSSTEGHRKIPTTPSSHADPMLRGVPRMERNAAVKPLGPKMRRRARPGRRHRTAQHRMPAMLRPLHPPEPRPRRHPVPRPNPRPRRPDCRRTGRRTPTSISVDLRSFRIRTLG